MYKEVVAFLLVSLVGGSFAYATGMGHMAYEVSLILAAQFSSFEYFRRVDKSVMFKIKYSDLILQSILVSVAIYIYIFIASVVLDTSVSRMLRPINSQGRVLLALLLPIVTFLFLYLIHRFSIKKLIQVHNKVKSQETPMKYTQLALLAAIYYLGTSFFIAYLVDFIYPGFYGIEDRIIKELLVFVVSLRLSLGLLLHEKPYLWNLQESKKVIKGISLVLLIILCIQLFSNFYFYLFFEERYNPNSYFLTTSLLLFTLKIFILYLFSWRYIEIFSLFSRDKKFKIFQKNGWKYVRVFIVLLAMNQISFLLKTPLIDVFLEFLQKNDTAAQIFFITFETLPILLSLAILQKLSHNTLSKDILIALFLSHVAKFIYINYLVNIKYTIINAAPVVKDFFYYLPLPELIAMGSITFVLLVYLLKTSPSKT